MHLQGAKPIELPKIAAWQSPPSPSKHRHRPQNSITRSIKSLIESPPHPPQPEQISSYQPYLSSSSTITGSSGSLTRNLLTPEKLLVPLRRESDDSGWDIVDDQVMRWATDYIPLASPGSRLASTSALLFATWSDEARKGKGTGGQLLAIATKSSILLYETPKGERAFKFVKVCLTQSHFEPCILISVIRNSIPLYRLAVSLLFNRPYQILPHEIFPKVFQDDFTRVDNLIAGVLITRHLTAH